MTVSICFKGNDLKLGISIIIWHFSLSKSKSCFPWICPLLSLLFNSVYLKLGHLKSPIFLKKFSFPLVQNTLHSNLSLKFLIEILKKIVL